MSEENISDLGQRLDKGEYDSKFLFLHEPLFDITLNFPTIQSNLQPSKDYVVTF